MNGQIYQMCAFVLALKEALQNKSAIQYETLPLVTETSFYLLPEEEEARSESRLVTNIVGWFEQLKKRQVQNIQLFYLSPEEERELLAFVNTTECRILCSYLDQPATYFSSLWKYNHEDEHWDIVYYEEVWSDAPEDLPQVEDNTEDFIDVLSEIRELAIKLDYENFADIFASAKGLLEGERSEPSWKGHFGGIPLSNRERDILDAVSDASVFGGMCSWNDDPKSKAYDIGLESEYEEFSDELLKQMKLAVLYVVNSWEG